MILQLDKMTIRQGDFSLSADWAVKRGARLALIGPSGGGKSTLLSLIAGFFEPDQGRLLIEGRDMRGVAPGKRPVSLLFQENNLFPHLSVAQNVGLGIRPDLRLSRGQHQAVERSLQEVGLEGMGPRMPAQLSGGQRQRVALARALLRDKPLLLLDEPFAALGPALRAEMLDLVARLLDRTGATLLMVTHDPRDAERIADQTALVSDGKVTPPMPTAELLADPPAALRAYLG